MTYQDFDEILEIIENSCLGKIPYDVLLKLSDGTVFGVDYESTMHITRFAIYGYANEDGEITADDARCILHWVVGIPTDDLY